MSINSTKNTHIILDKITMGNRIRKVREEVYRETRQNFAERCHMTENHLGKIERGEILISIKALDKICKNSGVTPDYILYGNNTSNYSVRKTIDNFLDNSSKDELKMYFKMISTVKSFVTEK